MSKAPKNNTVLRGLTKDGMGIRHMLKFCIRFQPSTDGWVNAGTGEPVTQWLIGWRHP